MSEPHSDHLIDFNGTFERVCVTSYLARDDDRFPHRRYQIVVGEEVVSNLTLHDIHELHWRIRRYFENPSMARTMSLLGEPGQYGTLEDEDEHHKSE